MRLPESLTKLIDYGIIQEVVRPLMSGKEAQVYLVISEGEERVAKVYKEAQARTFKHRAEYTEGRKTRNSRDRRAMNKRTRHGRAQDEEAWRSTEVDMIYRLRDAGVRVPEPHQFIEGVLVMELIKDAAGNPAPRLGDLSFEPEEALEIYHGLIAQVVRMLSAGVVHGDLSDFNVLMGAEGPAVIDFPQAVDPASNQNARRLLLRDVENLHRFLLRFAPEVKPAPYAQEMWQLYQGNRLEPTTKLSGGYRASEKKADTRAVLALIDDAKSDERARRELQGEFLQSDLPETLRSEEDAAFRAAEAGKPSAPKPLRTVVDFTLDAPKKRARGGRSPAGRRSAVQKAGGEKTAGKKVAGKKKSASHRRRKSSESGAPSEASPTKVSESSGDVNARETGRRRRRRRPKRAAGASGSPGGDAPGSGAGVASAKVQGGESGTCRDAGLSNAVAPAKKRVRRRRRPAARRQKPSDGATEP